MPWPRNRAPPIAAASCSNTSMKVWPMMRRFCSGSSTPASRSRNRSERRRRCRAIPSCPAKTVSIRSRSPARSRPVSTKTHLSRSPIARWISAAATDESTPPDKPISTRSSRADAGANLGELGLDEARHRPVAGLAADLEHEVAQHLRAARRMHDLGMELDAAQRPSRVRTAAYGELSLCAIAASAGGIASTRSP